MRPEFPIRVSGGFCILLAAGLLLLPLSWLLAALTAAAFHEICHLAAIRLCGGKIRGMRLGGHGAVIEIGEMSRGRELVCALAGPLGGGSLVLLAQWMPRLAVCAAVYSLYNLLPVYPLDGGRAVQCAAYMLLPPEVADLLCTALRWLAIAAILMAGIWASRWRNMGFIPLLAAGLLLIRTNPVKFPCKGGKLRVQ